MCALASVLVAPTALVEIVAVQLAPDVVRRPGGRHPVRDHASIP
jgi:hypothetical protein